MLAVPKKPRPAIRVAEASSKYSSGASQFCTLSHVTRMPPSRSSNRAPSDTCVVSKANSWQPGSGSGPPGVRATSAVSPRSSVMPGSVQKRAPYRRT
jgi:hypothetical protein